MSRSKRHTRKMGFTNAESEKAFKAAEHQRERTAVRMAVKVAHDGDDPRLFSDWGNPWAGPKDGKQYLRKKRTAAEWAKLMRK